MEELSYLFKILSVFLVTLLFVIKVVVLFWWKPRKIEGHFSKQGIRGPPYRFFFGNVKEIMGMMLKASSQPMSFSHNILPYVLPFCHHWKKIYGTTFLVWFGPTVRVTISDPNLIREIFTSKAEFYEKIEAPPLVKQLEGDGLLSLKGEKWAHHRRIISPTFHMENLKLLIPMMATSVVEMLDKWSAMAEKDDEVEIEVSKWFQALTEDVITRTIFGNSYEDGKAIFQLQSQQIVLASDAYHKVFIPGYRFFPTRRNITSWKLDKEIKKSLVKLIDRRKEKIACGNEDVMKGRKDLLGIMIQASNSTSSNVNSTSITVDDIVEECKTFFFAGKHTTSNLLTWTTILLAMHPQWQVRAREELLSVCGARDVPAQDDLAKLKTEIKKSLVKLIDRRKEKIACGNEDVMKGRKDLLGIMIQASNSTSSNVNSTSITVDDIVEECKTFFFAGKHTTSNLLTWTTILLAMHPQWQVRAREELLSVCGARDVPAQDDLAKLKTLTMIVNESLRLYPPVIATLRKAKADVELGGTYKIPCGTELMISILAVHHNHATWGGDANEFNPSRFAKGVSSVARHPFAFLPFGLGVRTCIGKNLAVLQTKLALAIMLHRFSFRLAPSYQHAPTVLMLLYPRYGAPIIFRPICTTTKD